ncbi:MAG: PDZ domain-containing protein [Firmicutes bacterium]|nr:PDZ domain-containing protein [Bacillota bacterium]
MTRSSKSTLKTEIIAFLLCLAVILGSAAVMAVFKQRYDARIAALTRNVEALQDQLKRLGNDAGIVIPSPVNTNGLSVPEIAGKAGASVVGIKITAQVKSQSGWFGPQVYEQVSEGSGIIYSSDGYIVTNYHVVGNYATSESSQIEVFLTDGRSATAKFIGGDSQNDLAVIKIDLGSLPVAQLGSSDNLHIGEFAMAIGNPLGMDLAGSVTVGVISGIERKVEAENIADSLIQTDAAINPGNSGGALVNSLGEVIGINTLKIASQGVEGIGFAIPIDYARPIIDSIISYGYVKGRPFIGITYTEVNERTANYYDVPRGILITSVVPGSAAARAALQENDIIVAIDDVEMSDMSAIKNVLKQHQAGDKVTVTFYRYDERQTRSTKLIFDERR